MKLYIVDTAKLTCAQLEAMSRALPQAKRKEASSKKQELSRRESIAAAWLMLGALDKGDTAEGLEIFDGEQLPFSDEEVCLAAQELGWCKGAFGKPFPDGVLRGEVQLFASASHSEGFVAAAVHTAPVGVDIQRHVSRDREGLLRIAERFSGAEYAMLEGLPPHKLAQQFTLLWAQKESVIKLDGRGMMLPLRNFSINADGSTLLDGRTIKTVSYNLPDAAIACAVYSGCACACE